MMIQPVVFLDFDDVIAIPSPNRQGGYDAIHALDDVKRGRVSVEHHRELWDNIFEKQPVANLLALHTEFNPCYVLSTSWTRFLALEDLSQVLLHSGLGFVVRSLHIDGATPKPPRSSRAQQIGAWLASHPEVKNWIAIDDHHSGDGFDESHERVVLCEVGKGFMGVELERARAILQGDIRRRLS